MSSSFWYKTWRSRLINWFEFSSFEQRQCGKWKVANVTIHQQTELLSYHLLYTVDGFIWNFSKCTWLYLELCNYQDVHRILFEIKFSVKMRYRHAGWLWTASWLWKIFNTSALSLYKENFTMYKSCHKD